MDVYKSFIQSLICIALQDSSASELYENIDDINAFKKIVVQRPKASAYPKAKEVTKQPVSGSPLSAKLGRHL